MKNDTGTEAALVGLDIEELETRTAPETISFNYGKLEVTYIAQKA